MTSVPARPMKTGPASRTTPSTTAHEWNGQSASEDLGPIRMQSFFVCGRCGELCGISTLARWFTPCSGPAEESQRRYEVPNDLRAYTAEQVQAEREKDPWGEEQTPNATGPLKTAADALADLLRWRQALTPGNATGLSNLERRLAQVPAEDYQRLLDTLQDPRSGSKATTN